MKRYEWTITVDGEEHRVLLTLSRVLGKTVIDIDGNAFDISRPMPYFFKKRKEIFRLCEGKQAILVIPPFARPDIVVDRKYVGSGREYH